MPLIAVQRLRSPSTVAAVPRSMPNSVRVAVDAAAAVSAVTVKAVARGDAGVTGAWLDVWAGTVA